MRQSNATKQARPVRSSRTQVNSYNEESGPEDSLGNDYESDEQRPRRLSLSLRPRQSNRTRPSYREESTDDDFESSRPEGYGNMLSTEAFSFPTADVGTEHSAPATQRTPTRARRKQSVRTRSQTQRANRTPTKRRLELGWPLNKRRKAEETDTPVVTSGVIPPWQTLPYHILFDIFLRASYPLVNERAMRRHSTVAWLTNVALLCRNFHETAMAALYHAVPLIPSPKAHALLSLLVKPQESLSTNYVNKIKELHVDAETLLVYKSGPTLGYFDLSRLVENTPQVNVLRIYHQSDFMVGLPPWDITRSKWIYPSSLFASINATSIRLLSWDWNARFMSTKFLASLMLESHTQRSFKSIQDLRIFHVYAEDSDGDAVAGTADDRETVLAGALKELPNLRRLSFLECTILNDYLFPQLPNNLMSLAIRNCDDVTAANLGAFLSSHGHSLRELNLSHNRHLSLSFIVDLKQSCQSLEKFVMDVSIHDWSSFHDIEPHFDELLSSSQVPTWPSTLQHIELIQLRKWEEQTAKAFFSSLIEAAPELSSLRKLIISAILKTGWRDRAIFREKWIGELEKVFLRRSPPPNPAFRTITRPSQNEDAVESAEGSQLKELDSSSPSKRKSARIASLKHSDGEDEAHSPGSSRMDYDSDNGPSPRQGMCDVVEMRIDNQRPRETQFSEQDFLDAEPSDDDDWNGRDVDMDNGGHAW